MNLQLLMAFAPFIALLYLAFALIQALRHKQQGIIAALLALLVIAGPLAAYFLAGTTLRARLINSLTLNAAIVFVGSLLILLIERGNRKRDPRRSYGMLGIGVSICLALITFGAPLLTTSSGNTPTANETAAAADTTLRNVAAVTRGAFGDANAQATNPAPGGPPAGVTAEPGTGDPTAVAQALMAQTGLTSDEITAQVDAGSTIADLVKANNGDLDAVIKAIATALDEMVAAGGRGGQLLERFGSDTTQIATQLVNGELAQGARFLLPQLLGGASAVPQFGGQNGGGNGTFPQGGGNGGGFAGAPPATAEVTVEATPEATTSASAPTAVAQALTAQTGLSADDLLAQIQAGSTVADLVKANNGDLDAAITAIAGALDELVAAGGRETQMIARLGDDTTAAATTLVNGTDQAAQFLLPQLIGGASAVPQFGGQNGGGNGNFPAGGFANGGTPGAGAPPDGAGAPNGGSFPGAPPATAEANVVIPATNTPLAPATLEAPTTTPEPPVNAPPAAPSAAPADGNETAVAQALTAQTGLASADLLTQIQAGSTIADLVKANNGDLNAAITAIAGALDELVTAGGREAQMIARFGSDTTQVATQLVNGELGQVQNFLLPQLISGQSALPQLNGQAPSGAPIEDTPVPTPTPTVPTTPTPTVPRPTRIVFPTATPTSEASATPAAEATGEAGSSGALGAQTCGIIVDYNLNLRDQPSTDGSTVLISIPFGSTVSADAHNSTDWYHVAYEGKIGWVSGQYVTPSAACADLPSAP